MSGEMRTYDPHEFEPMPEGEEEAPRYVRTMAIVRWIILAGMSLFALVMILDYFEVTPWATAANSAVQYHCPMHPTYVANLPGECPICGMTLVPIDANGKEISAKDTAAVASTDQGVSAQPHAKPGQYACPMDPDVISDKPGKCPKCGMNLELATVEADTNHIEHQMSGMGSAPVPGLVPVTIEPRRLQLIGVRTEKVERHALDQTLQLAGFVTPDEGRLSNIHVRFSGWVRELSVNQTGQLVKKDDPLLSVYSQDLYEAEQDCIVARRTMGHVANDELILSTRKQLLAASIQKLELLGVPADELARLDSSGIPRSELWVHSPVSGYVLEKNVVSGQLITPNENLFTVADLSVVWVLADLYEQDLAATQVGQSAVLTTVSSPGETFEGKIGFVYPSLSDQTRTAKARVEIANPYFRLRPGMYADVKVSRSGNEVLAVPAEAIMDGANQQYAFVVHEGTHFEPRLLKLGQRASNWAEVLSGLSEGEQVVTSANFLIDSESRLKAAIAGMGGTEANAHAGHGK